MPGRNRFGSIIAVATLMVLSSAGPAYAHEGVELELVFPHDPLQTEFVDSFGDARSGGRRHHGTDLMAPKHTPVYAVAAGVVTTIKTGHLSGWWIAIEHTDGWESWYMHLNDDTPGTDDGRADPADVFAPGVEVGSLVAAGQLIGWVGDSGNAEGSSPHTHFELHHDGTVVNPYPLLADAFERALALVPIDVYLAGISVKLIDLVE